MANKETRVLKQDTLEILRQKTNEISLHVGDNEQLDALLADKTYNYTASAGQVLFDGADSNSKVTRFELSPQHTIDNTGGSIILEGVSSIDSSYTANAIIYQGSSGSETWQAYIVSATTNKIIVRDSSGTFSSSADLKVGTSSPDTIANAKIARIIIESYPVAIARVYNNNTELTQGVVANGFFAPKIVGVSSITGSPSVGNAFSEGVTVYQNGTALNTQGDIESSSNWYGVLHSVDSGEIRFKTSQGSFSATAKLRVLGSSDEIAAANHGALTAVDSTYGSYIELTTPAANTNVIKVFSLDLVAAINELQDDIGTVENLTTSANDVVLAINEHDSELGTITAAAMATTASTVSGAIREHEDQIGNVDITGISGSNDTITGALEQIHNEIGDVTASNLGTSASNLTAAVREHEDQIGSESISSIDSGDSNNTITGALNQLHTEVGSLSLNTSAGDLTAAINEHEADIGNMTLTGLTATDLSAAVRELRAELGNHLEIDDATGYSATTAVGGIKEIQGDIGDVDDLDTNAVSDLVAAINELENVLRDDTTQRTGYVMGTNANNVVAAINEFETVLRGTNSNYTLNTTAQNVRDAINEHESNIGNMIFGSGGPVDVVDPNNISAAIRILDAEIGDTSYTDADLTTAIKNIQDDINVAGSLTTLNTTNKFIVGAINETDASIFNSVGSNRRTLNSLSTADKTSIVDAINEIYADIHTSGSVTLNTAASHLVGAINEIEGVFDASAFEISAGSNAFSITSGAFTVNSSGDIILDADDADVLLKDNGTTYGSLTNSSGNLVIKSGSTTMLTGSGANATFANNLTITNDLIVNNNVDIEGNVDVNGSIETDGLSINGTTVTATATELNVMDGGTSATSTTLVDADRVVVNDNGTMKQVGLQDFETYFEDALDTLPNVTTVGTLNAGQITSGFGSIDIGTSGLQAGGIHGTSFNIGNAQINEAELERIDGLQVGTVAASKVVAVDSNKDISGFRHITLSGELDAGSLDVSGNADIDGTLNIALGSTFQGAVNVSNTTGSTSKTTGALTVSGGVGINENLYVGGNLVVQGTQTTLNTETLTVEDTLVLTGNNLSSEPSSGGFGLEVGPITSPSGLAAGVTGAHSIVYNYATDQWEADGSLILSQATLGSPDVKVNDGSSLGDLESSNTLDFLAGSGLSVAGAKVGNDYNITYTNTDKGSSQNIFKTFTINGTSTNDVVADSNSDTLNLRGLDAITLTSDPSTDTISIDHDNFGTAGTYGQISTQDGKYIKSIITNAQGHVTAVTTGDFDTRYQATNPYWVLQEDGTEVDQVGNTDIVNFTSGGGIVVGGSKTTSGGVDTSAISIAHADTSSVTNLSSDNSGGTVLQDISLSFDTYGHTTARSIGTVNLDNRYIRSFQVEDGDGTEVTINQANEWKFVEGSGTGATIDINWSDVSTGSDTDPYDLTFTVNNTDRGSAQKFFRYIAVSGQTTIDAEINEDTLTVEGGGAITVTTDASNDKLIIAHSDTSSAASSNNSGRTYIQDITIDTYGHVTGIGTATETYSYTHPTYDGDDFSIDTGPLTGATVISDLDINVTTDSIGSVVDANGTVATRNLTLGDLGFGGWDLQVNGTKVKDVLNNGTANFKNGNHITATYDSGVSFDHNTFTSGGTYVGGSNNGIVIEGFHYDSYGHVRSVQTRDLDSRFDNYSHWVLQADSGSNDNITTTEVVDFQGGTSISTVANSSGVLINWVDPGVQYTNNPATFFCVQNSGSNNNPKLQLSDQGNVDPVTIVGGTNVTVTRNSDTQLTISSVDNNTDVDVSVANLRTRLGGISDNTTIGDGSDVDITFSGDVIVGGDLTVQGDRTFVNTETVTIQDNIILLNSNSAGNPTENAGIEVERGNSSNYSLIWHEGDDRWKFIDGTGTHNIPRSTEYMSNWKVSTDSSDDQTITNSEVLGIRGGTALETLIATTESGESHTVQVKHSDVNRSNSNATAVTLGYGGNFSIVTVVDSNDQGHITGVTTQQLTLPAGYSLPLASNTTRGGIKIGYTENNKNYPVELSSEKAYVNVPWTDTNTFRTVEVDTNGDDSANNTLSATETLRFKKGNNITLSESGGVITISSTDTDTNTFRTVSVDTNGDGSVNNTLSATEALVLKKGNNITLSESGGVVTISSTDSYSLPLASGSTRGGVKVGYTENGKNYPVELSSEKMFVNVPWTDTNTDTNTFRTIQVQTGSNTFHQLGDTETMVLKSGSNVSFTVDTPNQGDVTISATNTDTLLDDVTTIDNGADMILRHSMSSGTAHDVGITAGSNITITPGTRTFEIAATDTNTTYQAGTAISLSGTTFNLRADQKAYFNNASDVYVGNVHEYAHFDPDLEGGGVRIYTNQVEHTQFYRDSSAQKVINFPHLSGPAMGIKTNMSTGNNQLQFYTEENSVQNAKAIIDHAGDFHVHNDITAFSSSTASDVKLKENIERVEGALDKVSQLDGVTFTWKKDGKESAGVIAQNVEEVLPSAVKEVAALEGEEINKHVDYTQLSALFIEAIKELKEENKLLRDEIENLKSINS